MKRTLGHALAGFLLTIAVAAPAASATSVTVRIEGNTLAGSLAVNTNGSGVPGNASCGPHSAGEALELGTVGNWDRQTYVSTILGESHTYSASDYWAFWVNGNYSSVGICDYTVQPGDELLFYPQVDGPGFQGTIFPLYFSSVPSSVGPGASYTVTVVEHLSDGISTTPGPAVGTTVSDGSSSAVTDASGRATLTAPASGPITLVASEGGRVNSPRRSITVVPAIVSAPTPTSDPAPVPVPVAEPVPPAPSVADTKAPVATVTGLPNRARFAKGKGPRELSGKIADGSGIKEVQLRLRRESGKRCWSFSGSRERFTKIGCKAEASWFAIGGQADWTYQLPSKLPKGLYQLQVRATDVAGNQSEIQSQRFRVA